MSVVRQKRTNVEEMCFFFIFAYSMMLSNSSLRSAIILP